MTQTSVVQGNNQKFDFVQAINAINETEISRKTKGDRNALKVALQKKAGDDAFTTMANLGFIRGGFYIADDGNIIETYGVTQSYKFWNRKINGPFFWRKISYWLSSRGNSGNGSE